MTFLPGQLTTLTGTFRDSADVLANPTTVTVSVRKPDGTTSTPTATATATGVWSTDVTLDQAGVWYYTFTGTGAVEAIQQGTLIVRDPLADLLTVDQLREHMTSQLGDGALQRLLDANEETIVAYAGAIRPVVEVVDGSTGKLTLTRRAATITSIVERRGTTDTTMAADDYRIRADGYVLERLSGGTNSRWSWNDLVTITYVPVSDVAERIRVLIELCKLDLTHTPGLTSQTIGDFSESYHQGPGSYDQARAGLLATLREPRMLVI